ncbi:alcohol dehydrogenase [Bifidobacterium eulemuris]|uniref:Alcohol dehydrogenase n=1 Tax=Bifidobacterium eulemuris TaxID=1765219 RepID=A0A261G8A7_9BIFI|nr:alcohol dehydrogenase [Bifidobacterium eulemuris]OZG67433.1 alcohol dehydrogenase [Bifidobacterium eulemuris]QOL33000.1 alcohol dehydrogenase [Bifidobacterium eulemuris]
MTQSDTASENALLPWSHRQNAAVRIAVTLLAGAGAALIGTLAHRMGASSNIPYGLALAFVIMGLSAWCARARLGVSGLALHLIASSATAWGVAMSATSSNVLIVAGFSSEMPFFSEHAGYIWLYGLIALQVVMVAMPRRWFTVPPRTVIAQEPEIHDDAQPAIDEQ